MRVSQLLRAMDKDSEIVITDFDMPTDKGKIYHGIPREIKRDDPINKMHILAVCAFDSVLYISARKEKENDMETCKNCLHYEICTFHITGNENEKCPHYTPTADVVPKSEVALKVIKEVEQILTVKIINIEEDLFHNSALYGDAAKKDGFEEVLVELAELKKKYTEER